MSLIEAHTIKIKQAAKDLGFSYCGVAKAHFLEEEAPRLEEWLRREYQGEMQYLENHFDKRLDPRILVPGAKSVLSLLYNYFPQQDLTKDKKLKVAKYAYGEDYHHVIKEKLGELMDRITEQIGEVHGRVFVDSAPVMERAWAQKTGAGWIGKNTLLLNRERGSFFFLAELILDLELAEDGPVGDYCGSCTACIDACPTDAIVEPYVVDGSRCISYFTIELKEAIPEEAKGKHNDWIFGCDICQDVCPWNRFSKPHQEPRFGPNEFIKEADVTEWKELTEEVFEKVFARSPFKRPGYRGLKRNIDFVTR